MKDKKLQFSVASLPSADKNMLYFYGIMAEMERDFISTRTKAALAAAKARGVKLGGARPEAEPDTKRYEMKLMLVLKPLLLLSPQCERAAARGIR